MQHSAMLVKLPTGGVVSFVQRQPCALNIVDRNTGACLREQQLRISDASKAMTLFKARLRATCTDRGSGNAPCERALAAERFKWPQGRVQWACEVHKTATIHEEVLNVQPLDATISGMIRTALALRSGTGMQRFREALVQEVRSRLQVLCGPPPREATAYRRTMLNMFVRHGASTATKRLLLVLCPNGEWRAQRVQFYLRSDGRGPQQEEAVAEYVSLGLVVALCSAQPKLYPRHRWTGADIAVDELAILEACHRLMSSTFFRFAASHVKGALRAALLAAGLRASHYDPAELDAVADEHLGGLDQQQDREEVGGAVGAAAAEAGGGQAAGAVDIDWAKVNEKHRAEGVRFCNSNPLGRMLIIRILMEPMRRYMAAQFDMASDDWDVKESAKLARALAAGQSGVGARRYRLSEIAVGAADAIFFEQLRIVFDEGVLWAGLPPQCRIVSYRALVFKSASRAGCTFQRLLGHVHKGFPCQLFRLLYDPSLGSEFEKVSPCLLGPWARAFLEEHPKLDDPAALHILEVMAMLLMVDISQVESKHASIRRMLVILSTQTCGLDIEQLSALWVLGQGRLSASQGLTAAAKA